MSTKESELTKEIATYDKHVGGWAEHDGQFVLICGTEIVGFYDAYEKALSEGYTRFGMVQFLVKRVVSRGPEVQFVSRLFAPSAVQTPRARG